MDYQVVVGLESGLVSRISPNSHTAASRTALCTPKRARAPLCAVKATPSRRTPRTHTPYAYPQL